ncbi:MAG TPA: hypothetical protein VKM54_01980 [Myxococcota bacterium]|nr:hypothetical protein [Myxococcota bacterium]
MARKARTALRQLGLFAEASAGEDVKLPEPIAAEMLEALAALLLSAAGVRHSVGEGGEDEPEDHA